MALIDLNSIHHYQPPRSAGRPVKGCSAAWKRGASTAINKHNNSMALAQNMTTSVTLEDYGLIKCVDLTTSLPLKTIDLFGEPAPGFGGTEGRVQDSPSTGPRLTAGDNENDSALPSLNKLLRHAGEAQELQFAVSSVNYGDRMADGAIEYLTLIGCSNPSTHRVEQDGDEREKTDGHSSVHLRGGGSASGEPGGQPGPLSTIPTTVPGPEARRPALQENTPCSISDAPPTPPHYPLSLPSLPNTRPSSTSENQTSDSSDAARKDIASGYSHEVKEKPDTDNGHNRDGVKGDGDRTATGGLGFQDSSKRAADIAGLDEKVKGTPRSEKVRRIDPINETDDTDHDQILARLRSQPNPVFRRPPFLGDLLQREIIRSSSRSSGPGDSVDNPVTLEDDSVIPHESGASAKATGIEPETRTAHILSSHPREEPKILERVDILTASEPPIEPLDRTTFPNVARPQPLSEQVVVMTATNQPRSQALAALPLHHPPINPGLAYQHLKTRNGRSEESLVRDGQGRAMNTKCAGRIHGCLRVNWGTLGGYYRSLRHNVGHSEDLNRAE